VSVTDLTPAQVTAALATAATIAQYFGWVVPETNRADLNREANWSAREALDQCHAERSRLLEEILKD
jgi:hypothetical protein